MGVFNKTPYTNFHELNLNWIIKKIKEVAADNAFFKQFFKDIEDQHILGVVTKVTENNDNTVKTDYLNEDTQQMDDYTVYNKTGTDGAISGAVSPIANRVTTAEGDIDNLETQMANAIKPYNESLYHATDLNALALKAEFVRFGPDTLNIPVAQKQGYCLSIRSSANYGSQMAQTSNDDTIWLRTCQAGTWSSWRQIANASPQYLSGTITHHANITNIERFNLIKSGNVVVCDMVFNVGTAIPSSDSQAELFSGLPKAVAGVRFRCQSVTTNAVPLTLQVTRDGTIINQWSTGGIPAAPYQCSFTYITND